MDSGEGTTTKQMLAAPGNAVFVWVNSQISYPRDLARKLGREDLRIVSPMQISNFCLRGLRLPVVVDHAAQLSERQIHEIYAATAYLTPPNMGAKKRHSVECQCGWQGRRVRGQCWCDEVISACSCAWGVCPKCARRVHSVEERKAWNEEWKLSHSVAV